MILEGIVTTISPSGDINIAPMGPRVDADMKRFLLRPFSTSQTYRNVRAPSGVVKQFRHSTYRCPLISDAK